MQGAVSTPGITDAMRSPDARAALIAPLPVHHALEVERDRESTGITRTLVPEDLSSEILGPSARSASAQFALSKTELPQNLLPVISAWLKERVSKGGEVPIWPTPTPDRAGQQSSDRRSAALDVLNRLYEGLASSHFFAAQRLAKEFGEITATPVRQPEKKPEMNRLELASRLRALAISEEAADPISQSFADVAVDSENARHAARLLLEGQLMWKGDLAPGVPLRIERRDAWRSHPSRPGEMQRGAKLDIAISLPNLGALRIIGSQWADEISINVKNDRSDVNAWQGWGELNEMLKVQFPKISLTGIDP